MLYALNSICILALFNQEVTNFNDLGKLLLGGVAAAIVCAVAFTFVRLRLRDKKPATSSFISIASTDDKN